MKTSIEIFDLANKLQEAASWLPEDDLSKMEDVANSAAKAWSGSCLGYHSRVYYKDLQPAPPGAIIQSL